MTETAHLHKVLEHYGIRARQISPAPNGLINLTWIVTHDDGARSVLQKVNPMFPPSVHEDIAAVTEHLASRNVLTPRLIPSREGALFVQHDGATWRLLTWIEGESRDALHRPAEANGAAMILAAFHRAVGDLDYRFANVRSGVHDTQRHLARLRHTLTAATTHPRFSIVKPLGERILSAGEELPELPPTPDRVVHGDPKISNFLFDRGSDKALCMVDVDTFGRMPLLLELGDAFRSWCNTAGEDSRQAEFSKDFFSAGLDGYMQVARGWITQEETATIVPATRTIYIELAARFCTDALLEDFFAWNPKHYGSHSEHSEVRAAGQLSAAESVTNQEPELRKIVERFL